ncbi:MAG: hypothetical protein DHS20C05_17550 [Hyphococcus sp.]|nr:MAG: hypothetical protein DHS20C05_17550 [Marinicaulis sp.]
MKRSLLIGGLMLAAVGCATVSPRVAIKDRFVEFGLSQERASCLADELDQRLDRNDLQDVADYVGGLNAADSAGAALDALLSIENPRATSAIAAAGLSCAFSS